jgi:NAD(P)H-dependent flavin oxidoreductase YrpB (nitropropane dioxygenase family)
MLPTAFTELIGCQVPIQLAAMGGVGTQELAAAVADAGGLGMTSMVTAPADQLASGLERLSATTSGAVGVNFLMPFLDPAMAEVAASRCRVVEFFYGDPVAGLVDRVHQGGALVSWQVGSVAEARVAVDAGCDLVVAQGSEAGGHVRGRVALLPLLDSVLEAVEVPVVAAGGIGTARGVAAVLAAGAAGARVGTRFVAATESDAHPDYDRALLAADGGDTTLTETFGVAWPHAPHRVLHSCVDAAAALGDDVVGQTTTADGEVTPVHRFVPSPPTRGTTGFIGAMALYAGQGVGLVCSVAPAGDIVRELVEGAAALLGPSWASH